jgi:hypothetical protein
MKVKINDVELYYEIYGEGERIIFPMGGWMIPLYGNLKSSFSQKSIKLSYMIKDGMADQRKQKKIIQFRLYLTIFTLLYST